MKRFLRAATLSCCSLLLANHSLAAQGWNAKQAWVPEAPPVASVMAGYVMFENTSDQPIVVVHAESPQFDTVEFHRTVDKDGMARMVKQEQLVIEPGNMLHLSPGGYHLMLIGPKQPYRAGDTIEVRFESQAGKIQTVKFVVKKAGGEDHQHHHHH